MAQPFSTIEDLPDFDIEFPAGSFDPDPDDLEEDDNDEFPYHELDDSLAPIRWLG